MQRKTLKVRLLACFALFCLVAFLSGALLVLERSFYTDQAFAQDLIRLHVIANSNLPHDQELKLQVRDAVLQEAKRLLEDVTEKEEAYALIRNHAASLERSAREVVLAQGFDYPVRVSIGNYLFPERDYGTLTLPEGSYDAVRVEIGQAAGENWWCILFPPLCLAELDGAKAGLVKVEQKHDQGETGRRIVLRWKLWEQMGQTRYARLFQNWWQVSAAGLWLAGAKN